MRLPRDMTGAELAVCLSRLGYVQTRQTGSHVRLTCGSPRQHHVTIPLHDPLHDPLRVGTLAAILSDVAEEHGLARDVLLQILFR